MSEDYVGREACLDTAKGYIMSDRNTTYGTPEQNFENIAKRWSLTLGIEVKPYQVAIMMIDVKLARLSTSPQKADNWIDTAGYAACGCETAKAK